MLQAMALAHADGVVEVACNLLGGREAATTGEVQVRAHPHGCRTALVRAAWQPRACQGAHLLCVAQAVVDALAAGCSAAGDYRLRTGRAYETGKTPLQLVQATLAAQAGQ